MFIKLLEDEVINKIAAGEVVERPASVIKELVENSLDAGGLRLKVELKQGGKEFISVSDDGKGMSLTEAQMAIIRHATSKIQTLEDLSSVQTLGFRGEALASIASVSKFVMQGSNGQEGFRLANGQRPLAEDDWRGPKGNQVVVEDLFCTIPARKKFLKGDATELSYCVEMLQAISLSRQETTISLIHNGKEQFEYPKVPRVSPDKRGEEALRKRVGYVLGESFARDLIYISDHNQFGKLEGLISAPNIHRSNGKMVFTFVNDRWVKDKALRIGLLRGYHSHLLRGKFPVCVLFYEADPSLIDFNVHPAKTEVRFQYLKDVQDLIAQTIRKALRNGQWSSPPGKPKNPMLASPEVKPSSQFLNSSRPENSMPAAPQLKPSPQFWDRKLDFHFSPKQDLTETPSKSSPIRSPVVKKQQISFDGPGPVQEAVSTFQELGKGEKATSVVDGIPWLELRHIGQYGNCYLLFEYQKRLLAVDQHAFHERVLFERLRQNRQSYLVPQSLLIPEAIQVTPSEIDLIGQKTNQLNSAGFQWETLPLGFIEITAVPVVLTGKDIQGAFREALEGLSHWEDDCQWLDAVLATMACHGAVRAGESLDKEDFDLLLAEASEVDFYHNCPHGRPVFKWWGLDQVGRWFDR